MMKHKLKQLLISSRPVSWINTAYPFAAGYILLMHRVDATLIIGTLFFLIPYNLLMYGVNDVFDYESDLKNPRKGGVEGALIGRAQHRFTLMSAGLLALPFVATLIVLNHHLVPLITLLVVLFFVLAYSLPRLRFKERPFIDSMTSSAHFVGPLLYAVSLTHLTQTTLIILIAFFSWGMASHAFGAVQDIIADRAGGIGSVATVIGARATVFFSLLLYLLSAILLMSRGVLGIVCGIAVLFYIINILPFRKLTDKNAEEAHEGWRRFLVLNYVTGFVVTMELIILYRR